MANVKLSSVALFLLSKLDILSNQVNHHVFERLRLDAELLLSLAHITFENGTIHVAIVGQQAVLNLLGEVLCSVLLGSAPLWQCQSTCSVLIDDSVVSYSLTL